MPETLVGERLQMKDVTVRYGGRDVLRDCSLELRPGRLMALLGHNGAGKTTVLRTLLGLTPMVAGTILLGDRPIGRQGAPERARLGLGLVPDAGRGAVFGPLTVAENLRVARELSAGGLDISEEEVRAVFPIIFDHLSRPVADLSGGQRQMVAIAMALMRRPRILLLDEPSVGLAPSLVTEVMKALEDIAHRFGIGVLVVEQNVLAAMRVVDEITVLKEGRVVRECTPAEIEDVRQLWELF